MSWCRMTYPELVECDCSQAGALEHARLVRIAVCAACAVLQQAAVHVERLCKGR